MKENERNEAESERDTAEQTRISNETERETAEGTRQTEETKRDTTEKERIAKEEERKLAEESRISAESVRDTTEKTRIVNEEERVSAENVRMSNEEVREENEKERKNNEELRKTNETARETAEDIRETAETAREAYIKELKERVESGEFKGDPNVLSIGTVEKGEIASATIEGNSPNQKLNLVLPKGDRGEKGETGDIPIEQIKQIISEAIGDLQGIDYQVVTQLPETGKKGIIYLKANQGEKPNIYDEYIWVNDSFEKIGTTEVDLTQYVKSEDVDKKIETVQNELQQNINNNSSEIATLKNNVEAVQKDVTQNKTNIQELQTKMEDNMPTGTIITIPFDSWIKNEGTQYYEYDVKDITVTSNTKVFGDLDIDNMNKINSRGYIDSYNGGYKIILGDKPLSEITIDITKIKKQVI